MTGISGISYIIVGGAHNWYAGTHARQKSELRNAT